MKFYHYVRGEGGRQCFSHTGVGHKKFLGSFKKGASSFSHTEWGGGANFNHN